MNLEQDGFNLLLLAMVLTKLPTPAIAQWITPPSATPTLANRLDRDVPSHCVLQLFTAAGRRK